MCFKHKLLLFFLSAVNYLLKKFKNNKKRFSYLSTYLPYFHTALFYICLTFKNSSCSVGLLVIYSFSFWIFKNIYLFCLLFKRSSFNMEFKIDKFLFYFVPFTKNVAPLSSGFHCFQ